MTEHWVHGSFSAVADGEGDAISRIDVRLHHVALYDCALVDAIAGPPQPSPSEALQLGNLPTVALQPRSGGEFVRVSLRDAVLLRPSYRTVRDEGSRTLTLLSGPLQARLVAPNDHVREAAAAHAAMPPRQPRATPASAIPLAASGATVAPLGCAPLLPLGCGALLLGAGLLLLLAWGATSLRGLWPLLQAAIALGLLALLARLFDRRGCSASRGIRFAFGLAAILPLLAYAAIRGWQATQGECGELPNAWLWWVIVGAAIVGAALVRSLALRIAAAGLLLAAFALRMWIGGGCSDPQVELARVWVEEASTRDQDAERAAMALRGSGGGRLSIDQALRQSWPTSGLCGRKIHFSSDLLFGTDDANLMDRRDDATSSSSHPAEFT